MRLCARHAMKKVSTFCCYLCFAQTWKQYFQTQHDEHDDDDGRRERPTALGNVSDDDETTMP